MDGDDRDHVLCIDCLQRHIRVAIDIKGFVLRVMAEPMPDDMGELPPPEDHQSEHPSDLEPDLP
jgi:hypothetical protein